MSPENMVRVGTVTDISGNRVRVKFPDLNMTSGWLYVLRNNGSVTIGTEQGHNHPATASRWMPKINDRVVVLFAPIDDGDAFVLGGL